MRRELVAFKVLKSYKKHYRMLTLIRITTVRTFHTHSHVCF